MQYLQVASFLYSEDLHVVKYKTYLILDLTAEPFMDSNITVSIREYIRTIKYGCYALYVEDEMLVHLVSLTGGSFVTCLWTFHIFFSFKLLSRHFPLYHLLGAWYTLPINQIILTISKTYSRRCLQGERTS